MARTTTELVEAVIKVKAVIDLTPFIDYANEPVNDHCLESDYEESKLTRIETLLAAHFYSTRDPRRIEEQVDSIRQRFETKIELGQNNTRYGQDAQTLDPDGNLAAFNNSLFNQKPVHLRPGGGIGISWLGKRPGT